MKRFALFIFLVILCVCVYLLYTSSVKFKKYSDFNSLEKKIRIADKKIVNLESDIKAKESEINKIKEEKSEDVRLLEVWKKEAEKVANIS